MDANLTLVSALAKARLKETVQRQQQQLRETSDEPSAAPASNLDAVNKQRQPRKNSSGQRSGTSSSTSAPVTQGQRTRPQSYRPLTSSSCPNCGQGEHPRTSCPARAAKCNYCGCSGHFAVVCRKKAAGERKKPKEGEDEADSDDFPQADDSRVETEQNSNRVTDSMAPDDLSSPSLPGTDLPEYQTRSGRLVRRPDRYGFSN
ncbi:hypothetical protein MRX96_027455 [Rhipicephalus microplus]